MVAMRSPIPVAIREQLSDDPFMSDCIVDFDCVGRIEWDHAFKYQGKRVNELWAILPKCHKHHDGRSSHVETISRLYLRMRIAHFNAFREFKVNYPKSDLYKGIEGNGIFPLPEKKKGGRKSVSPLTSIDAVTSVVKRVDSAV